MGNYRVCGVQDWDVPLIPTVLNEDYSSGY